ncbi:MAG: rhodanese-like domain-containing protein [Bacteroidota bacterium]
MKLFSFLSCLAATVFLLSCGTESNPPTNSTATVDASDAEKKVDLSQKGRLPTADFVRLLNEAPNAQLIDVRTPNEVAQGALPNSVNINYRGDDFEEELKKLDQEKPVFVYCQSGGRSAKTYFKLKKMGFPEVYEMTGGYLDWKKQFGESAD